MKPVLAGFVLWVEVAVRWKRDDRQEPDDRPDLAAEEWLAEFRPVRPDTLTAADRDAARPPSSAGGSRGPAGRSGAQPDPRAARADWQSRGPAGSARPDAWTGPRRDQGQRRDSGQRRDFGGWTDPDGQRGYGAQPEPDGRRRADRDEARDPAPGRPGAPGWSRSGDRYGNDGWAGRGDGRGPRDGYGESGWAGRGDGRGPRDGFEESGWAGRGNGRGPRDGYGESGRAGRGNGRGPRDGYGESGRAGRGDGRGLRDDREPGGWSGLNGRSAPSGTPGPSGLFGSSGAAGSASRREWHGDGADTDIRAHYRDLPGRSGEGPAREARQPPVGRYEPRASDGEYLDGRVLPPRGHRGGIDDRWQYSRLDDGRYGAGELGQYEWPDGEWLAGDGGRGRYYGGQRPPGGYRAPPAESLRPPAPSWPSPTGSWPEAASDSWAGPNAGYDMPSDSSGPSLRDGNVRAGDGSSVPPPHRPRLQLPQPPPQPPRPELPQPQPELPTEPRVGEVRPSAAGPQFAATGLAWAAERREEPVPGAKSTVGNSANGDSDSDDDTVTAPLPVILPGAATLPRPAAVEAPRGFFEPAQPAGQDKPGSVTGSVEPSSADYAAPAPPRPMSPQAVAKLDQLKDLYLTAEAIGEAALDKHFDQVSSRQRELIKEFFERSQSSGASTDRPAGPAG